MIQTKGKEPSGFVGALTASQKQLAAVSVAITRLVKAGVKESGCALHCYGDKHCSTCKRKAEPVVTEMLDLKRHRETCNTCRIGRYCSQARTLLDLEYIAVRKADGDWPWDDNGKFIGHGPDCEHCNRTGSK